MGRQLRGKTFARRVPRDELMRKTIQALKSVGSRHHHQAKFMANLSQAIVSSPRPVFTSIHPSPTIEGNTAWKYAYTIVTSFLETHRMNLTTSTMAVEVDNRTIEVDQSLLRCMNMNEYMHKLLCLSRGLAAFKFDMQVAVFNKRERHPKIQMIEADPAIYKRAPPAGRKPKVTVPEVVNRVSSGIPASSSEMHETTLGDDFDDNDVDDFIDDDDDDDGDSSAVKVIESSDFTNITGLAKSSVGQSSTMAQSSIRDSDFDESAFQDESKGAVEKTDSDEFDVDVDVEGDGDMKESDDEFEVEADVDGSSHMSVAMPESSVVGIAGDDGEDDDDDFGDFVDIEEPEDSAIKS